MTSDIGLKPSDPRPGNEPYYIDSTCPDCGTELDYYHVVLDELSYAEQASHDALQHPRFRDDDPSVFYDEWICPDCLDGVWLDRPDPDPDEYSPEVQLERSEKYRNGAYELDDDEGYRCTECEWRGLSAPMIDPDDVEWGENGMKFIVKCPECGELGPESSETDWRRVREKLGLLGDTE